MNWEILRTLVLELISQKLEEEEELLRKLTGDILRRLEEEEDPDSLIYSGMSLTEKVYEAIREVVEISSELTGKDLSSVVEEVVNEVYPDGLKLSERLWKWDSEVRQTIALIIANGIRSRKTARSLAYEIESHLNLRGTLEYSLRLRYLEEIKRALSLNVKTPEDRRKLEKLIKELERTLVALEGARHTEKKSLISELKKALERKSNELMKRAVETYLKKEALRKIQRITVTETANTFHKVQIRATEEDPDLVGYRWKLSKAHPKPDVCDVYASVDYGLGRGVWPKDRVPRRKPHPHCLCYLLPVYSSKKKQVRESPEYNLKPLIRRHVYLKALNELGFPVHKIIDLDPETGRYLREKDFLREFGLDEGEWRRIKKALTDEKLKELGKEIGIGAKSLYREGDLIKHPLREEYTKVVKVIEDLLGNERVLTEFYRSKMEAPILPKEKVWQIPYRKWGTGNLEKLLQNPDVILHDKEGAYLYGKWYKNQLVVAVVGSDSFVVYTVYPLENANKILEGKLERYTIIYKR